MGLLQDRQDVIALGLVLLVIAGCGQLLGTEPPATPTDFPGLTGRLKLAGIDVSNTVSGDAGCTDPDLVPASISTTRALRVSMLRKSPGSV